MKNARLLRTTEMEKDDDLDSEDEERLGFSSIAKWFKPAEKVVAAAAAKKLQPQQVAKLSKLDDVKPSYLNNPLLKPEGEALKLAQNFEAHMMTQLSKTDKALLEKIKQAPGTPHGTKSSEDDEGIYTLYFSSQLSDSYTPDCPCHNDRKNKS
ncbi:hypothetical protein KRP22_009680 [Phytophthora ramorum]|nr:hypothetical protein KRP22_14625 [Phytophthora ramorum]